MLNKKIAWGLPLGHEIGQDFDLGRWRIEPKKSLFELIKILEGDGKLIIEIVSLSDNMLQAAKHYDEYLDSKSLRETGKRVVKFTHGRMHAAFPPIEYLSIMHVDFMAWVLRSNPSLDRKQCEKEAQRMWNIVWESVELDSE